MKKEEFEDYLSRKNEKLWEDAKKFMQEHDNEDFDINDTDSVVIRREK